MARAWPITEIAGRAGVPGTRLEQLLRYLKAAPDDARRIAEAYELLWDQVPPLDTPARRRAAGQALQRACRSCWPPPMAWDDDKLDDPDGCPAAGWRRRRSPRYRPADLAEDARFVREHGGYRNASAREVALRLGVSRNQLEKALSRAGRAKGGADAAAEPGKGHSAGRGRVA
jgi:hypothetical protein